MRESRPTLRLTPRRLGAYVIDEGRPLGSGRAATVYAGRPVDGGRPVAIKILRESRVSPRELERFHREFAIGASVSVPLDPDAPRPVVRMLDIDRDDEQGTVFIVMERMRGSLADYVASRRFDSIEAARVVAHVARLLDQLHRRGVYHWDVKPGNILYDEHGFVLADLGAAGLEHELGVAADFFEGTRIYSAPERFEGRALGAATDVYSLGATLFELLSGRRPPSSEPAAARPERVSADALRSASDAPPALAEICLAAMRRDPTIRTRTASGLANDLESWIDRHERGLRIEAVTASPPVGASDPRDLATLFEAVRNFAPALPENGFRSRGQFHLALRAAERLFQGIDGSEAAGLAFPDRASLFIDVARQLAHQGRLLEADAWFNRGIAAGRENGENESLSWWLVDHSVLLEGSGQIGRAMIAAEQALAMRIRLFGSDHPLIANALNGVANIHLSRGDWSEAERCYFGAQDIWRVLLGEEDNEFAWSLSNVVPVLLHHGDFGRAEANCTTSIALKDRIFGSGCYESTFPLSKLATLRARQAFTRAIDPDWALREADRAFEKALAIREDATGSRLSSQALVVRNKWAKLLARRGEHRRAKELCGPMIDVMTSDFRPTIADGISIYANILFSEHRSREAVRLLSRARAIRHAFRESVVHVP